MSELSLSIIHVGFVLIILMCIGMIILEIRKPHE